jgi:hypothetical protein
MTAPAAPRPSTTPRVNIPAPRPTRSGETIEVPWDGQQNAGPDCFWDVNPTKPHGN